MLTPFLLLVECQQRWSMCYECLPQFASLRLKTIYWLNMHTSRARNTISINSSRPHFTGGTKFIFGWQEAERRKKSKHKTVGGGNRHLTVSQGNLSPCQTSPTAAAVKIAPLPPRMDGLPFGPICDFIATSPAWPHVNESSCSNRVKVARIMCWRVLIRFIKQKSWFLYKFTIQNVWLKIPNEPQ